MVSGFVAENGYRIAEAMQVVDRLAATDRLAERLESGSGDDRKNRWRTRCLCYHVRQQRLGHCSGPNLPRDHSQLRIEKGPGPWSRSDVEWMDE